MSGHKSRRRCAIMKSGRTISCSGRLFAVLTVIVTLWTGGCGDFLTDKTASKEATNILDDLGRVETTSEPNIPMPSIYKQPPKIVEQTVAGAPEFKLFYFCRHLSAAELEAIVHKQFATLVFNAKGKSTAVKDYTVSSVAATNQLIVRCPTREDVEAVLELLQQVDIQPIQVKISCLISEVYADKTLDWETTTAIQDLFGESISAMPSAMPFGKDVVQWLTESDPLATFPGASMREFGRAKMGLNVGYKSDKFTAVVDILESQGYLKILMNPTLEVINGKTAKVSSTQKVPIDKIFLTSTRSDYFTSRTDWADIVDSLEITPHVFADGYIGLETRIIIGSKLTPEGIKQLPIVTKKEITNKETRIRPGESLIIGGLRKTETRDVLRGFPFLKDIPLIGILFSGRDFEERAVETIFILTPTISTGGIPKKEMMEEVERKQESVSSGKVHEAITDPLDILDGKRKQEQKAQEAEKARTEAEAEKAEARAAVRDAKEQVKRAKTEAEKATTEADKATLAEQYAKAEAAKAKADANSATVKAVAVEKQAQADTAKAKADLQKVTAEIAQAKADTAKAQTAAKTATEKATEIIQQAQAQIEKLKAELEKLKAETEKPKDDLQKTTAEAEKAKADAEKAATDAAKAKADAEKAKKEAEAKAKEGSAEEAKESTEQAKTEKPKQESESKEQG